MEDIKLVLSRHYSPIDFYYETVLKAVDGALSHLESGEAYPVRIEVDGVVVWKEESSFTVLESLEKFRSDLILKTHGNAGRE